MSENNKSMLDQLGDKAKEMVGKAMNDKELQAKAKDMLGKVLAGDKGAGEDQAKAEDVSDKLEDGLNAVSKGVKDFFNKGDK